MEEPKPFQKTCDEMRGWLAELPAGPLQATQIRELVETLRPQPELRGNPMANTTRPRVYVACLASYNAGTGHGLWIAVSDADTMHDAIGEVLSTSLEPGAEEWAIHDYDGFPSAIADSLGEHPDLEAVVLHAGMLVEHGDAWTAYVDWKGLSVTPSEDDFEEAYLGVYDNPGDYAEEHLTDTDSLSGLAEGLRVYFDFEAFERDMCLSGDIYRSDDGHVFLNL